MRTSIIHMKYQKVFPTDGRDFIYLCTVHKLEDGSLIQCGRTIEHESCPETEEYVRGYLEPGGWKIKPINDTSCHVTYIANADPRGWIPPYVVKMASKQVAAIIDNCRECLRQDGLIME
eukprot:TRINITY_DN23859_c0_g1_i1.p1 TRINITY_DN23859_c0_g1~~TRINITY_DN23859_c0_g1_i1.p1  ORF type:complete len:127 (+),score=21.99 TRINITY_DN23859_c0_g1_i1:27-383(+)